jgi:hypothetical protein
MDNVEKALEFLRINGFAMEADELSSKAEYRDYLARDNRRLFSRDERARDALRKIGRKYLETLKTLRVQRKVNGCCVYCGSWGVMGDNRCHDCGRVQP